MVQFVVHLKVVSVHCACAYICDMIKIPIFLYCFLIISKCFILLQTPLPLDIWLQSYEEFVYVKNIIKQRNLNTSFANISKTISPTSYSFLLIVSHMYAYNGCWWVWQAWCTFMLMHGKKQGVISVWGNERCWSKIPIRPYE